MEEENESRRVLVGVFLRDRVSISEELVLRIVSIFSQDERTFQLDLTLQAF